MEFSLPTLSTTDNRVRVPDDASKNHPAPGAPIEQKRDRR